MVPFWVPKYKVPYYSKEPKRDRNFDNHLYGSYDQYRKSIPCKSGFSSCLLVFQDLHVSWDGGRGVNTYIVTRLYYVCTCTYIYICMYVYMYIYMCMYICTCIYIHASYSCIHNYKTCVHRDGGTETELQHGKCHGAACPMTLQANCLGRKEPCKFCHQMVYESQSLDRHDNSMYAPRCVMHTYLYMYIQCVCTYIYIYIIYIEHIVYAHGINFCCFRNALASKGIGKRCI